MRTVKYWYTGNTSSTNFLHLQLVWWLPFQMRPNGKCIFGAGGDFAPPFGVNFCWFRKWREIIDLRPVPLKTFKNILFILGIGGKYHACSSQKSQISDFKGINFRIKFHNGKFWSSNNYYLNTNLHLPVVHGSEACQYKLRGNQCFLTIFCCVWSIDE